MMTRINSPERPKAGECEIRLGKQSNDAGPVEDTRIPLLLHIPLPDMVDDEGEGMDQGQDKESI